MSETKFISTILIVAIALLLVGAVIFFICFASSGFKISAISTAKADYKTYSATEYIDEVVLAFDTDDIEVVFDENALFASIKYPILSNKKDEAITAVDISVDGGKLTVKEKSVRPLTFTFGTPDTKVTLTVPSSQKIALKVITDTGDVSISNATVSAFDFSTDTGDVKISDSSFESIHIDGDTGDVKLLNSMVTGAVSISSSTGDIEIAELVAESVDIDGDTADVKMSGSLKANRVEIELDTGDVNAKTAKIDASNIKISTDTGDVKMSLVGNVSDYKTLAETDTGDKNIANSVVGDRLLTLESDTGDLLIYFVAE